uniref:hypothetical protein n=1 Tax=Candidatus Limisoma sp. TaxID=3076476 RepID=UPI00402758AA
TFRRKKDAEELSCGFEVLEYFNNLEHSRRVSGAGIYDMPDGKKVCSKSEFVLENCGKMPNIAN